MRRKSVVPRKNMRGPKSPINVKHLPKINMVFHGKWDWVFAQMLDKYKEYFEYEYEVIPSVDPIPGCDVYQYWRPQWPVAQKFFQSLDDNSEMFKRGIHMLHDSPYDVKRHNTEQRKNHISKFKYVMCTSMEQFNYYESLNDKRVYCPLANLNNEIFPLKLDYNKNQKIRLGFVARLYPDKVKGEDLIVDIASKLSNDSFEFVFYNDKSDNRKNVLHRNMVQRGFGVSNNSEIDVLLICSKYEGTPLPLIEALKSGTYVLSTDAGESSVVLPKTHICKTAKGFATKLNKINQNRSMLQKFISIGPKLVEDRTWENFFEKNRNLWESIIK